MYHHMSHYPSVYTAVLLIVLEQLTVCCWYRGGIKCCRRTGRSWSSCSTDWLALIT